MKAWRQIAVIFKFWFLPEIKSLPPANEVWGKVIFLHQFVILFTGAGCTWLLWGACMVARGGMRGCSGGGVHGCSGGACVVAPGGVCAWDTTRYGDTVNERAVRILLECILV